MALRAMYNYDTLLTEPLALMLQKKPSAKEVWDALVEEMTKKPKMVVTSLQRQL